MRMVSLATGRSVSSSSGATAGDPAREGSAPPLRRRRPDGAGIAPGGRPGRKRSREALARGGLEGPVEVPELGDELPPPGGQAHPALGAPARRPLDELEPGRR